MRIRFVFLSRGLIALAERSAMAQPPSPLDGSLFGFPGESESPASAISAGFAAGDQWLGDEPFYNPAARGARRVIVAPTLFRVSRQDLRADNRNFDDNPLFFDLAGAAVALPYVPVWVYVHQPTLRFEDFVFNRGTGTDPTVQPGVITGQSDTREGRAGISASAGWRRLRGGVALEWTRRQDRYFMREQSGAPDQGDRELSFEGDGTGYDIGLSYDSADTGSRRVTIGAALRKVGELDFDATQALTLLSGDSLGTIHATRESGWEGGVSARYFITSDWAALAAYGGRSKQEWKGFDLTTPASTMWRVGVSFHDALDPWTLRAALGIDEQKGAPEPRAGVFGLGFGWNFEGIQLDFGLQHRSIERKDEPRSYEDRVIGSVAIGF
ncbi:MAG: hypothetical protein E6K80_12775 [Candidatus Eisenbacteria bacterium]|uniref:Uncharacterized protein n=1 Tax=Eiseniibacteriota bacterium TaxID=2212470 RepID=A0A538TZV5_UNCEI|nr:MAG: hypothetical protein E6K80_12775 [Candidatus Eisenbacteria bacterium]